MSTDNSAQQQLQRTMFDELELSDNHSKVFEFYQGRYYDNHPKQDGTRNDLQASTGLATQTASGRTSDLERLGIIYKNQWRREGQACLQFEPDPGRWAWHAMNYRNRRRKLRCDGVLNEYGHEMAPELRKALRDFARQTRIA